MAEAFDPNPLLRADSLHIAATLDDAREIVDRLVSVADGDALADLLEHAVDKSDRAHAVIFELLSRLRWPDQTETGVQMVSRFG